MLTYREVSRRTGLSKSAILRRIRKGAFPKPFEIDKNVVRFDESEVQDWIAALPRVEYGGAS